MIIEIGNVACRLVAGTDDESNWVAKYLSFTDSGFKSRGGRISLYNTLRGTFPGGLFPLLQDAATRDGVRIEILDKRVSRITPNVNADLAWLRDYQRDAVEAAVKAKRGIIRAPTGSGKTEIIIGVVRRLPGKWLFLVHRDVLVTEASARFKKRNGGITPNILSRTDPRTWKLNPGINFCTLQSLAAAIRKDPSAVDLALKQLDGLIVDECHVAPADVYFRSLARCPAEYRLGFSGTPLDRTDNRSLMAIAALGKVIYQIKAAELVAAGMLAVPKITMIQVVQKPNLGAGSFKNQYDDLIAASAVRNKAIVDAVARAQKPCMVFVKLVNHGHEIQRMVETDLGVTCEFVWGSTPSAVRTNALERLSRGDSQVMVASVVMQEGVDVPELESVIVASGGKSVIATLQRIGRGMRTNGGQKMAFEVVDIYDRGSPMLERHAIRRMKTYVREGYSVVTRDANGIATPYKPVLRTRRERKLGGGL